MKINYATIENKLSSVKLFKGVLNLRTTLDSSIVGDKHLDLLHDRGLEHGINVSKDVFAGLTVSESNTLLDKLISLYGVDMTKFNSTFYKSFEQTRETPEFVRYIHQFLHYASTYGGLAELRNSGEVFEPEIINEENWDSMVEFTSSLIDIKAFSLDKLVAKTKSLVSSGMALKEEDVMFLSEFIIDNYEKFNNDNDFLDTVKNRELLALIALTTGDSPKNFDLFMKVLFLSVIDSPLVVNNNKSKVMFAKADKEKLANGAQLFKNYVDKYGVTEASKHVSRYRDFIMLIKNDKIKSEVNKVLKLSKKNYVARKVDPLSTITNFDVSIEKVEEILSNSLKHGTLNIYRVIRIMNAIRKDLATDGDSFVNVIKIRNGKTHILDERTLNEKELFVLTKKLEIVQSFVQKLIGEAVQGKAFVFEDLFVPVAPTSGKSFSGFLPEYSYFKTGTERAVVGIAWDTAGDIDLHGTTQLGEVGWNSSWHKEGYTYTGDMTNLNEKGFAAEYLESTLDENEVLNVSVSPFRFSGDYQLIVANGKVKRENVHQAKNIHSSIEDILYVDTRSFSEENSENLFSLVKLDGEYRAVVTSRGSLSDKVTSHDKVRSTLDYTLRSMKSMVTMKELLELAGADVYSEQDLEKEENKEVIATSMKAKDMTQDLFTSIFADKK